MHHMELARAKMDFASTVNQISHCLKYVLGRPVAHKI